MKLAVAARTTKRKSETKKIRREGNIPAILYSKGEEGKEIVVNGVDFQKILNTTPQGSLSSKVFTIECDKKKYEAVIKGIQYDITTYRVIHLDFEELHPGVPVTLNIPIQCINTVDCAGVKLGGVVRLIVRQLEVTCMPDKIPSHFEIDVRDLTLGQMKKLSDLQIPSGVRPSPTINLEEAAVVIARK
jgi:large subunit ribosomal protein L25